MPSLFTTLRIAAVLAVASMAGTATATASAYKIPFSPTGPWNVSSDPAAPIDPSSALRTTALLTEVQAEQLKGTGPWINDVKYSAPVYRVSSTQPRVPVTLDNQAANNPLGVAFRAGVPIPSNAVPATGTDGAMIVYQASTDTLWEFWRAAKLADGWHASWGGAMQHVSTSPGNYSNLAWPGLASYQGWSWGTTASSQSVMSGLITISDLSSGHIDHALSLQVPTACQGWFTYPAQRTDGSSTAADCLPEGAKLRIDPTLDLSTLTMPPITRQLAQAAQTYGMIVSDQTHSMVGFRAESPRPIGGYNPYAGPTGFYGGLTPAKFLGSFPWDHLQVMPMRSCTVSNCTP
jgi:hypothetical protein